MEYTVKQVAEISSISVRTLHYYDEINLLKPAKINSSGYRMYDTANLDRLQQIMFYKRLGFSLDEIKQALNNENFSNEKALKNHYVQLQQKRDEIDLLLNMIEKTIKYYKGEQEMTDNEKFEAFKKQQLEENNVKYGKEIHGQYDEQTIEQANKKYQSLTEDDFEQMKKTEQDLFEKLQELTTLSGVDNETGKMVFELHKKWLLYTWPNYSAEAHKGLVDMYLADERFAKYYNQRVNEMATQTLFDAVKYYA